MQRYRKIVNVQEVLENSSISTLMKKGLQLHQINEDLQNLLPQNFRNQYVIADLQQNTLVIHAANASIRQGFLLQQQKLLHQIQQKYPTIMKLVIKVTPIELKNQSVIQK